MSESQSVSRWEYKTVRFKTAGFVGVKFDSDAFDATLNRFDSEGWELLSALDINCRLKPSDAAEQKQSLCLVSRRNLKINKT